MKDFVKTIVAVICAFVILGILRGIFFLIMLGSMALSGSSTPAVPKTGGVLDLNLSSFTLGEQSQSEPAPSLSSMSFETIPTVGIRDAVMALQEAAVDPAIKFVFLRPDGALGGISQLEELRKALSAFRESGKPVLAYTETPGNGSYFLASVADKVLMGNAHGGTYTLLGLSSQSFFLKDLLDKLGVNVQLIRHGKFKSAGEMFIRNTSSSENREQNQVMISSLWKAMASAAAASRDMSEEQFNDIIDKLVLVTPEDFVSNGLVDELVDYACLQNKMKTLAQVEDYKKVHLVSLPSYIDAKVSAKPSKNKVAVLYADGEIVDGSGKSQVAGDRFMKLVEKLRKDKNVKAVVLRVNSPGGSVSASVKIRTALDSLMKEKPLVASFGDYAASGGYWISSGCQKIYADATTVTGSIGVFSLIPDFSKVTKKVGVNVESVGSNKHSDMMSLMRPFDAAELSYMQASVEDIYELFVNLVATSRGLSVERVDQIAQGRVWAAADALEVGLVDEIGTLQDAISYAAALADLPSSDDYSVASYPAVPSFFEQLMSQLGGSGSGLDSRLGLDGRLRALKSYEPGRFYARLPYDYEIR
ncbi:MAG: signal peptide peptidase SppA [Bacteroidales bacterium]|nr:signal peptide peptidase SppA [Bacteroidales bacterium]